MSWLQLTVEVQAQDAATVEECLLAWGALAVTLQDAADNPLFEPPLHTTPLWQTTRITGLFAQSIDLDTLRAQANANLPPWTISRLQDQDWERVWLADFKPMRFGQRLWICPAGQTAPDSQAISVDLDPGLAFGTGTHPTTALCLSWLDQHRQRVQHQTVLDYGCGSGILAIAALKLGARHAFANDIDPQALLATAQNAHKNGVHHQVETYLSYQQPPVQAAVVMANILANPLIALAPTLSELCANGGDLILSGILSEQANQVSEAYSQWFHIQEVAEQDGWARIWAERFNRG